MMTAHQRISHGDLIHYDYTSMQYIVIVTPEKLIIFR